MSWWDVVSSPIKEAVTKNVTTIMSDVERAIGIPVDEENQQNSLESTGEEDIVDLVDKEGVFLDDELVDGTVDEKIEENTDEQWKWDEEPKKVVRKSSKLLGAKKSSSPVVKRAEKVSVEDIEDTGDKVEIKKYDKVVVNAIEEVSVNLQTDLVVVEEKIAPEVAVDSRNDSKVVVNSVDEVGNKLEETVEVVDWERRAMQLMKEKEEQDTVLSKLEKQLSSRENQMESISNMASEVNTENHILKDSLAEMKKQYNELKEKDIDGGTMEDLKKEFSIRLGKEQKTVSDLKHQIQSLKKQLETPSKTDNGENKDQLIDELRQEGITLSKKQGQLEKLIKTLRQKEKESDSQITTLIERATKAEEQVKANQLKVKELSYSEKSANDTIVHLKQLSEANAKKLEKQDQIVKEANSRIVNLESALEKAWQDLAEQRKINLGKETQAEQSVFEAESAMKEEFTSLLRQNQSEAQERENALNQTIEELRNELSHVEAKHFRNEELLQRELQESQRKYVEHTNNLDSLGQDNEALQSLHREMDSIRSSQEANRRVWESLEQMYGKLYLLIGGEIYLLNFFYKITKTN